MSERRSHTQKGPALDHLLTERIEKLILKLKGWFCHERRHRPRPRVRGLRSRTEKSNQRWAMDVTHVYCGEDGWGHPAAVIDCHDREIVG